MIKSNLIKKLAIFGVALSGALVLCTSSNAYYNNEDIGYNYSVGDYGINNIYDYSYIGQYKNIAWSRNCNYLLKEYLNQNDNEVLNYCLGNATRWFDNGGSIINYNYGMNIDSQLASFTLPFFSYAYDSSLIQEFEHITKQSESEDLNTLYLYTSDNSCFSYNGFGSFEFNSVYEFNDYPNLILEFSFKYPNIDLTDFTYVSGNTKTISEDNLSKYVLILSCDNTYFDFNIHNENDKNLINYNISPLSCGFVPFYEYYDAIAFTDDNSSADSAQINLTSWNTFSNSFTATEYNNHYAVYVNNNRDSALNQEYLNTINNLNSQIQALSVQLNELNNTNSNLTNQVNTLTLIRDGLASQLATYNNMSYQEIYNLGYNSGISSVSSTNETIMGLFGAIANVPITILNSVMGPTLMGIPLITILLNFLSVLLILWLIKKLIK